MRGRDERDGNDCSEDALDWWAPSSVEDPEGSRMIQQALREGGVGAARAVARAIECARADGVMASPPVRPSGHPLRPPCGRFSLRLPSRLHEDVAQAARRQAVSMNTYIVLALFEAVSEARRAGRI